MNKIASADGTSIAFERVGRGPRVILIGGALCDRGSLRPLAAELASDLEVVIYDRRGRGDSGDALEYAVEREVEDLDRLLATLGGTASVYGHSSGAGLAAEAASRGLKFVSIVLHDAPYGPKDAEPSRDAEIVLQLLAAGRDREAVELHLAMTGMPPAMAAEYVATWANLVQSAPTLAYDYAVMGLLTGSQLPTGKLAEIAQPTLVLAGQLSPPFMVDAAHRMADVIPEARLLELEGENHAAAPQAVAPVVSDFLRHKGQ